MKTKSFWLVIAAVLIGCSIPFAAEAATGFESDNTVLYQPEPVLRERLPSREPLYGYIEELRAVCRAFFAAADRPETFDIVVAIKSGKQSRVWFASSTRGTGDAELDSLRRKLEAVTPPDVHQGPVAFAISARIAGGKVPEADGSFQSPVPTEWQEAADQQTEALVIPDDILRLVWPDPAVAPTELVTQVLEPGGGKVLRPKEWFYEENHGGHSYVWTFAREDASKGPYTTGFRIQALLHVKESMGKSARDFVLDFAAEKKKQVDKVLRTCPEEEQGIFIRTCLEVEDGRDHILYSLFYGPGNVDAVVVAIAGTTKELWETYAPTFDKMSRFELLDVERLRE